MIKYISFLIIPILLLSCISTKSTNSKNVVGSYQLEGMHSSTLLLNADSSYIYHERTCLSNVVYNGNWEINKDSIYLL